MTASPDTSKGHPTMTQEGHSPMTLQACGKRPGRHTKGHSPVIEGSLPNDPTRKYTRRDRSSRELWYYSLEADAMRIAERNRPA